MYVYMFYVCVHVHMCVNVFRGQRSILGGFLYHWSRYFVKMGSFVDTGAHQCAGLAG